ncbi:undecaprenyl-phosphate alpha-N-acetylglucosaminyl 1-phosphate transferase, partial [Pseudomonas aeruginosa]|nr:undecaprenyl-phosphate alpha-N-acetylglucosaminyl 1-phosphate transferase [Pseudomonas aeruginosa]
LALVGVVAEYTRIVPEWVMLILFLVAFFLYGYCIKRAWKGARLVKRIRRRIRRHSGNNPKLTK